MYGWISVHSFFHLKVQSLGLFFVSVELRLQTLSIQHIHVYMGAYGEMIIRE